MNKLFVKTAENLVGRWKLKKSGCITEAITVLNANRDHCGDTVCGTPLNDPTIFERDTRTLDGKAPQRPPNTPLT
jgi:hypothetical protein